MCEDTTEMAQEVVVERKEERVAEVSLGWFDVLL